MDVLQIPVVALFVGMIASFTVVMIYASIGEAITR
jgi:hypothetical protein